MFSLLKVIFKVKNLEWTICYQMYMTSSNLYFKFQIQIYTSFWKVPHGSFEVSSNVTCSKSNVTYVIFLPRKNYPVPPALLALTTGILIPKIFSLIFGHSQQLSLLPPIPFHLNIALSLAP